MRHRRIIQLGVIAALTATALLTAGNASATRLYEYTTSDANDPLPIATNIDFTLASGTSALLKDTLGGASDTCTSSELLGLLESTGGGEGLHPRGEFSVVKFGGCSHTTSVIINRGTFEIKNIAGTTNGTFIISLLKVTVKSTIFGISCIADAGTGTTMGTVTGAKSSAGLAALDMNGLITLENGCGDATWTGNYQVTKPTGMTVENS